MWPEHLWGRRECSAEQHEAKINTPWRMPDVVFVYLGLTEMIG
jgi:hypothetical protein